MESTDKLLEALHQPNSTQQMRKIVAQTDYVGQAWRSVGDNLREAMVQTYETFTPEQKKRFTQKLN